MSPKNTNVLEGFECPNCGSLGPFRIAAKSVFEVYDSGADSFTDVEWEDNSAVVCCSCEHEGTVKSFARPGMECARCGGRQFFARQTGYRRVIVDDTGDFVRVASHVDQPTEVQSLAFEETKPYGPYVCTACNEEFDDLTPEEREQADNDAEAATGPSE